MFRSILKVMLAIAFIDHIAGRLAGQGGRLPSREAFLGFWLVHPRVAPETVAAVRTALLSMAGDAEGRRVLEASAALIKQKPPFGFVSADEKDYDNYRRFFRTTSVKPPSD
jgi:hypothetical protein